MLDDISHPVQAKDPAGGGGSGRRCRGTTAEGAPCNAPPIWVDPTTGFCFRHDPTKEAERQKANRKGGTTTGRRLKRGIHPDRLPPLNSPEAVQTWVAEIALALAQNQIPATTAQALKALMTEWRAAYDAATMKRKVEELTAKLEEAKRQEAVRPQAKVL